MTLLKYYVERIQVVENKIHLQFKRILSEEEEKKHEKEEQNHMYNRVVMFERYDSSSSSSANAFDSIVIEISTHEAQHSNIGIGKVVFLDVPVKFSDMMMRKEVQQ